MTADREARSPLPPRNGHSEQAPPRNIVRYYGGGKDKTQHFYAMEYMDGGSVEQMLKKKGRYCWEETIEQSRQVALALEYAHNHGIIHRDLKPANLFMGKDGRLKLGDFGIARDTQATAFTAAGRHRRHLRLHGSRTDLGKAARFAEDRSYMRWAA